MSRVSWAVYKALDEMQNACEVIYDFGCSECPIRTDCIRDKTFWAIASEMPHHRINDFLKVADRLAPAEDMEAEEANLRRCDPDDF